MLARDRRFDGLFFVGVSTTGVYCRPVCTAKTPGRARCSFHGSAAAAEVAGFRACFVCRPEIAPGASRVDATASLVQRAVTQIDGGFLEQGSLAELAAVLGVTDRHLRRACEAELGVAPVELAQTRRLAIAKQLLHDTSLPLAEVALASGFASIRRFNALFRARFDRPPSAVRKTAGSAGSAGVGLVLRLDHRPPLAFEHLLSFLQARAVRGVERVTDREYARVVAFGDRVGIARVRRRTDTSLEAELDVSLAPVVRQVIARLRHLFDLDARPDVIHRHLSTDPLLRPWARAVPGMRTPGAFDGFETGVRAILGQQVSVAAATTIAGRLVSQFGEPVATTEPSLAFRFPDAAAVGAASVARLARLGLPGARAEALRAFARAVAEGRLVLSRGADPSLARETLLKLQGVGPWTAEYIAMRALGDPDAFVASDLVVRRALGGLTTAAAERRAEAWRPFRAYGVMHLWNAATKEPR